MQSYYMDFIVDFVNNKHTYVIQVDDEQCGW